MPRIWRSNCRQLRQREKQVQKSLRKAEKVKRKSHMVRSTPGQRHSARVLMVLHAGEPTAALRFLTQCSKPSKTLDMQKEADSLQKWWWSCSVPERDRLVQEESLPPQGKTALSRARKFLVESDLERWVDRQNVERGITPHSAVVLEEAHTLSLGRRVPVQRRRKKKHAYQWLRRWRMKWAVRLTSVPPNEILPVPVLQEKAGAKSRTLQIENGSPGCPKPRSAPARSKKSGSIFWPQNWGHHSLWSSKRGRFLAPVFWQRRFRFRFPVSPGRGYVAMVKFLACDRGELPQDAFGEHG